MSNARISISDGGNTLEIEGTESFVEKHLKDLLPALQRSASIGSELRGPDAAAGAGSEGGQESLRKYMERLNPDNVYEAMACVMRYARKYQNLPELEANEIRNALVQSKHTKPPKNWAQALTDCRRRYGYIETGSKKGFWKLTHQGETMVEFDLPRT